MKAINKLMVSYNNRVVGTLALYKKTLVVFEYDNDWLSDGFSISPISLPLEKRIFIPRIDPFNGLFGVFDDSLPDGFGRLLVDTYLVSNNINPLTISYINRLAVVGNSGMGAFTYKPMYLNKIDKFKIDLDRLALNCNSLLKTDYSDNLDELFLRGGSSSGAKPKILTNVDGEEWIIKFPSLMDSKNIGKQEYEYSLCAKECGITMEKTRLFPSKICSGYFGTKRFDRKIDNFIEKKTIWYQ